MATTIPTIEHYDWIGLIRELVALVVAITGLIVAVRAGTRAKTADAKSDIANVRAGNNAKAITAVSTQLTAVALQTPAPPASPQPAKFTQLPD